MSDQEAKDQKNKEAVAAMKAAQSHMRAAIERIGDLENALKSSADNIARLAEFLPDNLYIWTSSHSQVSAKTRAKEYEAYARKYL